MKDNQRRAMFARINKYYSVGAFHPTAFEKGTYAVSLYRKGRLQVDENRELVQVTANNKSQAIKKALETREMKIFIERTSPKNKSFDPVTSSSEERIEETPRINKIQKEMKEPHARPRSRKNSNEFLDEPPEDEKEELN